MGDELREDEHVELDQARDLRRIANGVLFSLSTFKDTRIEVTLGARP